MVKPPFTVLAAVALVAACATPAEEPSERAQQPVVEGEPSDETQDGVLLLRGTLDDSELICTASLVAPNLVLTARHCVAYLSEGLFSCNVRGELEPSDAVGGRLGLHVPAEQLELYARETPRRAPIARAQRVFSTLSPTICTNDIAFVLLDRALDLPLVPMRLDRAAEAGEQAVLVGYGMDEKEAGIDYVRQPRLQRRDLRIAAVGPASLSDGVTTAPPRSILLRGPSGCLGDSGGPLLSQASGAVLGVYSLQAGESCSAANIGQQLVQVQPFDVLIAEAFAAAGAEPIPEPLPSNAGGESGQSSLPSEPSAAGAGGTPEEAPPETQSLKSSGCSVSRAASTDSLVWLLVAAVARRARRRR